MSDVVEEPQGLYKRDDILRDLRRNVISVEFIKEDNTLRKMRCTLMPKHLPAKYNEDVSEQKNEKEFHQKNPNVIAAWDVEKGGWRSFRINSVQYVEALDNY